jgi:sporulation protein YlmC with PRC-barrel domain
MGSELEVVRIDVDDDRLMIGVRHVLRSQEHPWGGRVKPIKPTCQGDEAMARATAHPDHQCISSEDIQGTEVYGADGKNIGEIDHLIIDKVSGRVAYAVMSFGGFVGLGHSHYPIPWGALTYDTSLSGFRTNITEQQLKDAPEFSDDSWQDRGWETRTHQYYGTPTYWEGRGGL